MLRSILPIFILCLPLASFGRTLLCRASYNTDVLTETRINLMPGETDKLFGSLAGLQFYVSHKGSDRVELQVFNSYEPSRSYASANFTQHGSHVELVIWKQDYLLEVSCISEKGD